MSYFNSFPYINYEFPDNVLRFYKNISLRPDLVEEIKNGTDLEIYEVQEGETPEILAYEFYNDVTLNWVIMLANDIFVIYKDWPMSEKILKDYLYEKYRIQKDSDGVDRVLSDDQVFEFLDFTGTPDNNYSSYIEDTDSDNSWKVLIRPHHFEDSDEVSYVFNTFSNTVDAFGRTIVKPKLTPVSHLTYEEKINDDKRKIYIPPVSLVLKIKRELDSILNE